MQNTTRKSGPGCHTRCRCRRQRKFPLVVRKSRSRRKSVTPTNRVLGVAVPVRPGLRVVITDQFTGARLLVVRKSGVKVVGA